MKQPFTNNCADPPDKAFKYACSVFPKPPAYFMEGATSQKHLRTDSAGSGLSDGESNSEDEKLGGSSQTAVDITKLLPPIGVFWDIENCQVPRRKSAVAIAQAIRDRFFNGYREAEFVVVCDVTKENSRVIKELNYAQVNLIHVSATCKNAADEKLRQSIRRFADIHSAPAAIILISSDINFAGDLSDLRHRKKIHVILLHNDQISEALILCANEHYSFNEIIDNTITKREMKESNTVMEVLVSNLPKEKDTTKIKSRLRQLCDNLGGRVSKISKSVFSIRFPTVEFAVRAQKRMAGEDVFGNKIKVSNPFPVEEEWNFQSNSSRKIYAKDDIQMCHQGAGAGRNNNSNNKKDKDENSMPFDEFFPRKQQLALADVANSGPNSHHLEPTLQQQISKTIVPFTSNNVSSFTFSKVPNIENLKIIQNPTSSIQKSYFNNLETYAGVVANTTEHSKQYLENRKFNNIFTNQADCSSLMRLNNSTCTSNTDTGMNSLENNQLLSQTQKLQFLALVQRNISPPAPVSQNFASGQINKSVLNGDRGSGRLIRGIHGGNNNNVSNNNSNINNSIESNALGRATPSDEDCESLASTDAYFEPIQKTSDQVGNCPVDLHISGLDPYMDFVKIKTILTSMFKMHVEVLSVSVFSVPDGNVVANVKVPTIQDAQYAISQLQRREIGSRRITIAFQNSSKYQRQLIRSQVAQLLSELPQHKTPLFRFIELFKTRFLNAVSVSELKKMKDVCVISEEENGRMISANSLCPMNAIQRQEKKESVVPYCPVHAQKTISDSEPPSLPTVRIGLSVLSKRIELLLDSHDGKLPLASLSDCYQAQFGPLPKDGQGVPLEHLVSCIKGLQITQCQGSFKYLSWASDAGQVKEHNLKCVSPMLVAAKSVFAKELLELLKNTPKCVIPFSQFVPSYHRRYGKQCRVSDYGHTKLIDLLESLPHILQVIGNGTYKMVTLSHRAQIRRFTSHLTRILRNQTNKQLEISNFPSQYEKIFGRTWDPCHYGLCEFEDLLNCVPHSTVVRETKEDGQMILSIPKREPTPEEVELTKKFALEVVEILKRAPNFSVAFSRFIPAYHNHFGRQCRVSSYGCFKLIELFEAIPDTVFIEEDKSHGEKYVVLTPAKQLQVLAEKVCKILAAEGGAMSLVRLEFAYKFYQYESGLSQSYYKCETFEELLMKIPEYVKIEKGENGRIVVLKNGTDSNFLIPRIRYILLKAEKLPLGQFIKAYTDQYGQEIDVESAVTKLPEVAKLSKKGSETYIQLTPLSVFANQMYLLLLEHRGRLLLPNFESAYLEKFKKPCQPSQFGFQTLSALLSAIPETVTLQSSGYYTHERILTLNITLKNAGFPWPILNNENCTQHCLYEGAASSDDKPTRPYDLWKGGSLFPWRSNINNLNIPENIKVPHPSELPVPSPKLSLPIRQMLPPNSVQHSDAEATSTTDENVGDSSLQAMDSKLQDLADNDGNAKKKNRIAAQFENRIM